MSTTDERMPPATASLPEDAPFDFEVLFANCPSASLLLDANLRILHLNSTFERISGFSATELAGHPLFAFVHPEDRDPLLRRVSALQPDAPDGTPIEFRVLRADGGLLWVAAVVAACLKPQGRHRYTVAMLDATKTRTTQDELWKRAFSDSLTGLANRSSFIERLGHAVERLRRRDAFHFGVLFMDLDRFKLVNDSLGHPAGDDLLVQAAARIRASVRPGDTVARFGGDEFAVLLEQLHEPAQALRVTSRIQEAFASEFVVHNHPLMSGISIGLAFSGDAETSVESLFARADAALYQAKRSGRGRTVVAEDARPDAPSLPVASEFREAIHKGEISLHYLTVQDLHTGDLMAVEGLARWEHPRRGLVSPSEFLPLAEEQATSRELFEHLVRRACADLQSWLARGSKARPPLLLLNLTEKHLAEPENLPSLARIVDATPFDRGTFALEIPETAFVSDPVTTLRCARHVRDLGFRVFVDHYSGRIPLSVFHDFVFQGVKIERTVLKTLHTPAARPNLLRTLLDVARGLGLPCIAEGIEQASQVERLRDLGCQYGQGFFFSQPLPPGDLLGSFPLRDA